MPDAAVSTGIPDLQPLVVSAAAGDRRAEAAIVDRFARGVRVLVARQCRPGDPAAEDIAQDVLRILVEQLRKGAIRDGASIAAWLQTCIRRATTAYYREQGQRLESSAEQVPEPEAPGEDAAERIDEEARARRVRALIAALPVARDRDLLMRFYLKEQDKAQICAELGVDEDHLRRVLHRARQRLRELMNDPESSGATV